MNNILHALLEPLASYILRQPRKDRNLLLPRPRIHRQAAKHPEPQAVVQLVRHPSERGEQARVAGDGEGEARDGVFVPARGEEVGVGRLDEVEVGGAEAVEPLAGCDPNQPDPGGAALAKRRS